MAKGLIVSWKIFPAFFLFVLPLLCMDAFHWMIIGKTLPETVPQSVILGIVLMLWVQLLKKARLEDWVYYGLTDPILPWLAVKR